MMKISVPNLSLRGAKSDEAIPREIASPPEADRNDTAPIDPHAVLDSLIDKHRRFETLEKEGLIAKNDLPMKEQLRQAIGDLEALIVQLENAK
ncbi:MAG: hypothetical protein Q8P84_00885 [Deltaproteobacteria bacterium]|nr:hypothetical protein [Deltaproteobacteria bacterium]